MTAVLVSVAEAVKEELNGGEFSLEFTAERSYADWDIALESYSSLHVDVVPVGDPAEIITLGMLEYVCEVDVGVRKRLGPEARNTAGRFLLSELDALAGLVQEINEFFFKKSLTAFDDASWRKTTIRAHYVKEHLRDNQQYTGIVRVTYNVARSP